MKTFAKIIKWDQLLTGQPQTETQSMLLIPLITTFSEWKFDLTFASDFNTVESGTEVCQSITTIVYTEQFINMNPIQTWIDVNGEQIEIPYNAGDYKVASNFNIDIK